MSEQIVRIAVVGAGAAGCYVTQSLLKDIPECQVSIFEALPTPYGLVRYGVATDHQSTKRVSAVFDRILANDRVEFFGNQRLGTDFSLSELREHFHAIVLATGLDTERQLDVPGIELLGVHSSGEVTRYVNAYPDAKEVFLGNSVVVVGAGNIAADVLRYLLKQSEHFEGSDIADCALEAISAQQRHITVLSRSAPAETKISPAMLRELGEIENAGFSVRSGSEIVEDSSNTALTELLRLPKRADATHQVEFVFDAEVEMIHGVHRVEGATWRQRTSDKSHLIKCDTLVTAIGYETHSLLHEADMTAETEGVFRTGWLASSGKGTLPDARAHAKEISKQTALFLSQQHPFVEKFGSSRMLHASQQRSTSFQEWLEIDTNERELATPGRVRRKMQTMAEMLDLVSSIRTREMENTP